MNINKIVIYITTISIILIVALPTLYKVIKQNHDRLYLVSEKDIIESAENCYFDSKCSKKVTLKELYDNKYLEKGMIDPVTKEVYLDSSYVLINLKKESTFYPEK